MSRSRARTARRPDLRGRRPPGDRRGRGPRGRGAVGRGRRPGAPPEGLLRRHRRPCWGPIAVGGLRRPAGGVPGARPRRGRRLRRAGARSSSRERGPGQPARAAAGGRAGPGGPELPPGGGADAGALARGRPRARAQPPDAARLAGGPAGPAGRGDAGRGARLRGRARCSRRPSSCSPTSRTSPRRPRSRSAASGSSTRTSRRPGSAPVRAIRAFGGYAGWAGGQLEEEVAEEAWVDVRRRRRGRLHGRPRGPLEPGAGAQGRLVAHHRAHAGGPLAATERQARRRGTRLAGRRRPRVAGGTGTG